MRLHLAVGIGVAGTAIIAIWLTAAPAPRDPVRAAAEVPVTEGPIRELQREVAALKRQIAQHPIAVVPVGELQADAVEGSAFAPEPAVKPAPGGYQPPEIAERLDARYAGERGDRASADKLESDLRAALTGHGGSTVSSVECTTSLCKVSVLHDTGDAQRELASLVASQPALAAGVFYYHDETAQPPRTMLYVIRDGYNIRELMAAQ